MVRVFLILGIVVVLLLVYWQVVWRGASDTTNSPTPNPPSENVVEFEWQGAVLRAAWIRVDSPSALVLYPNFTQRVSAQAAKEDKGCRMLVSGGFYTKENTPIGLFVSEGEKMADFRKSALFNGFFTVPYEGNVSVSVEPPKEARVALQGGPVLIKDGEIHELAIRNDEPARRIVVGIEDTDKIIFITLFDKSAPLRGPYLEELPQVITRVQEITGMRLNDALNLDGGSASAFYTQDTALPEFAPVGSYFCVRE